MSTLIPNTAGLRHLTVRTRLTDGLSTRYSAQGTAETSATLKPSVWCYYTLIVAWEQAEDGTLLPVGVDGPMGEAQDLLFHDRDPEKVPDWRRAVQIWRFYVDADGKVYARESGQQEFDAVALVVADAEDSARDWILQNEPAEQEVEG